MPFFTEIYKLSAFLQGESYSASYDKYRFNIIDSQFRYLYNLIGDGRISGWDIVDNNDSTVTINSGMGIIDGVVTRTFGPIDVPLVDDSENYIYIKRINNSVGFGSSYSDIKSINYIDNVPPALVSNIVFTAETSSLLSLKWDANTELDFKQYIIWRSTNNINYEIVDRIENNIFTDIGLSENTRYYYKIQAEDNSGNVIDLSLISNVNNWTKKNLVTPSLPLFVTSFPQDESIQIAWGEVTTGLVGGYKISIQAVDDAFKLIGSETTINITDENIKNYKIKNLNNNYNYYLKFNTVNIHGVESTTKKWNESPKPIYGPDSVDNLNVSFLEGENNQVVLNVTWDYDIDPYDIDPYDVNERFMLRLIKNGEYKSDPIIEKNQYNSIISTAKFYSYIEDENIVETITENIKSRTTYILEVKSIDNEGNTSAGSYLVFTTPNFKPPLPVTDMGIDRLDSGYLYASWTQSRSEFVAKNYIQWNKIDIDTGEETVLKSKTDILLSNGDYLKIDDLSLLYTYKAIVTSVDDYGLESDETYALFSFDNSERVVAQVPIENVSSYNGFIELIWDNSDENIKYYKIWRSINKYFISSDDFTLIETVSSSNWKFRDYEIDDKNVYVYIVTAVNRWGYESQGPSSNEVPALITVAVGRRDQYIGEPTNLNIIQVGNSINLSWDNGEDPADGYQILRSVTNKGSFTIIGSVDRDTTNYTDDDILLKSDNYYYIVSKYRNEATVVSTLSGSAPENSIGIYKIISDNGTLDIKDIVIDLLDDVVISETEKQIDDHKHSFDVVLNKDRRINLQNNIIIDQWITSDYRKYITNEDIDGASSYVVKINGTITDLYYSINSQNKYILFEEALYGENGTFLYDSPPDLTLELIGVQEVMGELTQSRINGIFANQFNSGIIKSEQIPDLNHDGRIYENLIPISQELDIDNGFKYTYSGDKDYFNSSIIFYDIIELSNFDGYLLAATSNGVYYSEDLGATWSLVFAPPHVPTKIFYSERWNRYFLITPEYVYASSYINTVNTEFVKKWARMPGTEAVKMIRDIEEDGDYYLYITTDLGVYRLDSIFAYDNCWDLFDKYDWDSFTAFDWFDFADVCDVGGFNKSMLFRWKQLPIVSQQSSDCFSIVYDSIGDRIIVSNETNMFYSSDRGDSWLLMNEFDAYRTIWSFDIYEDMLFILTDNRIYRYDLNLLIMTEIAVLNIDQSRKLKVFDDYIYITTDKGLLRSLYSSDIMSDSIVYLYYDLDDSIINGFRPMVTSINIIDDNLFVGLEEKLYMFDDTYEWNLLYKSYESIKIPSVYKNDIYQYLGNFIDSQNIAIYMDTRQDFDDIISVDASYGTYKAAYGGWVRQKYDAIINIYINGNLSSTINSTSSLSNFVETITSLEYPVYDDINSNFSTAKNAEDNLNNIRDEIIERFSNGTLLEDPYDPHYNTYSLVSQYYNALDFFMSQIYEDHRVIQQEDEDGNIVEKDFVYPPLYFGDFNTENGHIDIKDFKNKYDALNIDILGSSFSDIGDSSHPHAFWDKLIGESNSGLSEGISRVQQSNIIQTSTFNKRYYDTDLVDRYNSVFILPNDTNWYDKTNSDIDYLKEQKINNNNYDLCFISDVSVYDNYVYICGGEVLLKMDIDTYDIEYIDVISGNRKLVKSLKIIDNTEYVLTDYEIIYKDGDTWEPFTGIGLPNSLYNWAYTQNTFTVGSDDGIYYYNFKWEKIESINASRGFMYYPNILFFVLPDSIYRSDNNIDYTNILTSSQVADSYIGSEDYSLEDIVFNDIILFNAVMFVATNKGLYKGDGSFYNEQAALELLYITGDESESRNIECTALAAIGNYLYIGLSNGNYYVFYNGIFTLYSTPLDIVRFIRVVNNDIWIFSDDSLYIVSEDMTIGLSGSVPV